MSLFTAAAGCPPSGESQSDAETRRRIHSSLDESLIVEAAAGTGKTTVLIERLVALLQSGRAKVDRIVAVTFTRKAAGELKLRLRRRLDEARQECEESPAVGRLEEAMSHLEEARIGTIHSFCAELLRERPVEARVDPDFVELSETEAARLYNQAFRRWIQTRLGDLPQGLRRALARLSQDPVSDATPLDRLRSTGRQLIEWRDFPKPYRRVPFDREKELDEAVQPLVELADLSGRTQYLGDQLRLALAPAREFATWIRRSEEASPRNYDTVEALLAKLLRDLRRDKRQGRGFFADDLSRDQVLKARSEALERLEALMVRADADLAALLQGEMWELIEQYEDLKKRSGKLDFVDLLIRARALIRDDRGVRCHFQSRFTHLFIDEFQDTDPLQAEILLLLSADDPDETDWRQVRPRPGGLFVVGDPKQSIYRFRRADVSLYQDIRARLAEKGVPLVHLSRSFRSVSTLQGLVNSAFSSEMDGDTDRGQPDYVPLQPHRQAPKERPSVIALPVPFPYGHYRVTFRAIEASLPDATAAFVDWMIRESGWTVDDPESPGRPIALAPRHICLLFRRFMSWGRDVTRDYTAGLEARGIAHQLVGARSFHHREEVETLKAALTAIEWPDDELSVFAVLKGTLFAVPDSVLLNFRLTRGALHPFRPLPADLPAEFEPVATALGILRRLHCRRNRRAVVETINELLEVTRAHAGFALRPAGNQVLANVQKVCDMARAFEVAGGLSFRGFVEHFAKSVESNEVAEGPHIEEGSEGVSIMTVHAAKGLEFPVVVLADSTAKLAPSWADKWVDFESGLCAMRLLGCAPWDLVENEELERRRQQAEGIRIAYVAATRARDILVVPTVGDQVLEDRWLSPLNKTLYPNKSESRESSQAPGCPPFGKASVLQRPPAHDGGSESSVRPGSHTPNCGRHQVVWWDPSLLQLGVDLEFGLRQEEILAEDRGGIASEKGLKLYNEWKESRRKAVRQGAVARYEVFTPSQVDQAPPSPDDYPINLVQLSREEGRPSGALFGTLVHTALRDVDLRAQEEDVSRLAKLHGRILGASEAEVRSAVRAVLEALANPLLERGQKAQPLYRELPLLLETVDGRQLDGAVDLLYRLKGSWTVIEFKTDADLESHFEYHRAQLSWYLKAVADLTGDRVEGYILGV